MSLSGFSAQKAFFVLIEHVWCSKPSTSIKKINEWCFEHITSEGPTSVRNIFLLHMFSIITTFLYSII